MAHNKPGIKNPSHWDQRKILKKMLYLYWKILKDLTSARSVTVYHVCVHLYPQSLFTHFN